MQSLPMSAYPSYTGHSGPCTCVQCTTQALYHNHNNQMNNAHQHNQPRAHQPYPQGPHQGMPRPYGPMNGNLNGNQNYAPPPYSRAPMNYPGGENWGAPQQHTMCPPQLLPNQKQGPMPYYNPPYSHDTQGQVANGLRAMNQNQGAGSMMDYHNVDQSAQSSAPSPPAPSPSRKQHRQRSQSQEEAPAEVRVRFVNAKFMRHDPYSHNAYLITGMAQQTVQNNERRGSTCSGTSSSAPPSSPSQVSASSSTAFTEEATISESRTADSPTMRNEVIQAPLDPCMARLPAHIAEDGSTKCRWMDVYEDTGNKMQKRRYRFSGVLPCGHRAFAKRLRYRRGWTYFMCVSCGFKWGESGAR